MTMTRRNPTVVDDDRDTITVKFFDGMEIRSWSYKDESERRTKILLAREYVEGWRDAIDYLRQ
jgi:hypothetical protein